MAARAILFLVGAVLGTALDHLHVASGTTSYPAPVFFQAAWWTPLLFGFAAAGFADLHARLRQLFGAPPRPQPKMLAVDFVLFVAAYWASAYLPLPNAALLGLFASIYLVRVAALRDPPHRIVHGLLCAALGVFAEWALTGLGLFTHHRADFLRVPLWLPGLYLLSSPLLAGLDDMASTMAAART
jgi:hypothetical protein